VDGRPDDRRLESQLTPQARGVINCPYVVCASANVQRRLPGSRRGRPHQRRGRRPIDIIAPPGTLVNVRHPGACVGGQTELQPRIIELIQGRVLSQIAPERTSAASGRHLGQLPLRRRAPAHGPLLHPLPLRGHGLGRPRRNRRQQRAGSFRTGTARTRRSRCSRPATRGSTRSTA
jgi:hypothetical protein